VVQQAEGLTVGQVTEIMTGQMLEMTKKMEALMAGIAQTVGALGDSVQTLSTRVETSETVAKAAKDAVDSTLVLGSAGSADDHLSGTVRKMEYRSREIDTAYSPRRRGR
jgi:hypothetical protein